MRRAAGQVWGKEAVTDLGQPQTPRKEGRGTGAMETGPPQTILTLWNSNVASPILRGDDQDPQRSNAPQADSVLSSIGASASMRRPFSPNSVMINVGGEVTANVTLTDVRKQLMTMGLFPPDLYGVGESFEETRRRYVPPASLFFFHFSLSIGGTSRVNTALSATITNAVLLFLQRTTCGC